MDPPDGEEEVYIEVFRFVLFQTHHICRSRCSQTKPRRAKRRKTNTGKAAAAGNRVSGVTRASTSFSALLDIFQHGLTLRTARGTGNDNRTEGRSENRDKSESDGFEATMEGLLPEYLEARQGLWAQSSDVALFVRLLCEFPRAWCLRSWSCFAFVRYVRMTTRVQAG